MSDFLGRLAARSLGVAGIAQPVGRGMFAPGIEQTGRSQESFTEAVSNSAGDEPQSRTAAPSITSADGSTATGDSARVTQTDFSVVDARIAAPYDVKSSESKKETPTSPLRPAIDSLEDAERIRTTSKDSAEAQGILADARDAHDARGDVAPTARLPVPIMNLQREAFPLSSFSAGAGLDHRATVSASAPVVKVSIGRVEVRAEFPTPAPRTSPQRSSSLSLSLDEYARQRREGKR